MGRFRASHERCGPCGLLDREIDPAAGSVPPEGERRNAALYHLTMGFVVRMFLAHGFPGEPRPPGSEADSR